ncbi:MAG: hypothetical protein HY820_07810 [Acidobacteria bacterium]|nr:hypothetical protein [Acidobacteriota bacterium]
MSPDLSLVLRIQSLDLRTAELEREIAALPKRIQEIEKQLDSHKRRLEMDRAALAGNQKERKRLDGEVQIQQQKISKLKDQMTGAKTNEQYRAFQHEIEFCEKEIRKYEDRILELMTESEKLADNVKTAEAALAVEAKQVDAEKQAAREKTASTQKALADMRAERQEKAGVARKDLLANYERIRKNRRGVAVAEAVDGRCNACNMILRPQVMQDLRTSDEGLLFCESCKRILYYNPPVAVDSGN